MSNATYTRLENANQNVTLKTLTQLCRTLDCDMGGLFSGETRERSQHERPPAAVAPLLAPGTVT